MSALTGPSRLKSALRLSISAPLPNMGAPGQFYTADMVADLASDKDTETIFLLMDDGQLFRLENFDYGAMPYKPGDWQEDGE